jgi:drug/metabolite transporter (DMT)-like permease
MRADAINLDRPWRSNVVLVVANLVYATAPVATRFTLDDVPPALLALARCVLGGAILLPLARRGGIARGDHWRIAAMGVLGFGAAFALGHWGLLRSTATNASLLIIVEPVTIMLLSPLVLRERLRGRESAGAALALAGTILVVLDGIPGFTTRLAPHWRGDLLLVASGVGYAAYLLIGRDVLRRHPPTPVTALSIVWGAAALLPLAALEWSTGARPAWTGQGIAGVLYLAVLITAVAYLAWNWALERVPAPRAAIFLTVQPIAGAVLGILMLGDPFSRFTAIGGLLIVAGLLVTAIDLDGGLRAPPKPPGAAGRE